MRFDDGSDPERAADLARASDVAIVFAADYQTEFIDRRCLSLQCPPWNGDQDALIETVADANPRTVVVLETGGPVLTPWRDKVAAILEAWYPGPDGGAGDRARAVRRRRPGRAAAGDLPEAARTTTRTPATAEAYPGVAEQVEYKEGVLVGYRWFDARGIEPAFPFGFGLSYTKFRYGPLKLRRRGQDGATVSFTVKNVGRRRTGVEVPQLYLGLPSPSKDVEQPPKQLKDFRKLTLRPGQRKRVTVPDRPARPLVLERGRRRLAGRARLLPGDDRPLVAADRADRRGILPRRPLRLSPGPASTPWLPLPPRAAR